ncbi:hypothetical protein ONE63_011182 [Megalurothrips usitatus]|uniref:Uncharacterized protein n=1 Tax=Megalurothrips usitatus TaxID=439358 RepID=A0AAV7X362_9NEOP|nr:hypothetical protein ONE63_011182 [Megalurothrips usitatus]
MAKLTYLVLALCALQAASARPHHLGEADDVVAEALAAAVAAKEQALQELQAVTDAVASGDANATAAAASAAIAAGLQAGGQAASALDSAIALAGQLLADSNDQVVASLTQAVEVSTAQIWRTTSDFIEQVYSVENSDNITAAVDVVLENSKNLASSADERFESSLGAAASKVSQVTAAGQNRLATLKDEVLQARQAALDALDAAIQAAQKASADAQAAQDERQAADKIAVNRLDAAGDALAKLSDLYTAVSASSKATAAAVIKKSLREVQNDLANLRDYNDAYATADADQSIRLFSYKAVTSIHTSVAGAKAAARAVLNAY